MTEASDIENLLRKHNAAEDAKLERLVKRAGWGKALLVGAVSVLVSAVGMAWQARGYYDRVDNLIQLQRGELDRLKDHVDAVERTAIAGKKSGDSALLMLYAQKGGWPPGVTP